MSVSFECGAFSGRGLCERPIPSLEQPYRALENSRGRGCWAVAPPLKQNFESSDFVGMVISRVLCD